MAKTQRWGLLWVVAVLSPVAHAEVPKILLVQFQVPVTKDGVDLNIPLLDPLAEEIDRGGKLAPIAWTMTDPNFRELIAAGKVKDVPKDPDIRFAHSVAKTASIPYVMSCESKQVGMNVVATILLYRNGRQIWKDTENMRLMGTEDDQGRDVALSVARTVAMKMASDPLKALQVAPRIDTEDPTRGQLPTTVPPVTDPPKTLDTQPTEVKPVTETIPDLPPDRTAEEFPGIKATVQELLVGGREAAAILYLRDAIDQKPLDMLRRRLLVETLLTGRPAEAAQEARRAANLDPDNVEIRVLAAQAWVEAGNLREAQADLNESLARHPDSVAARLLLAELALRQGLAEQALEHTNAAIKATPTAEAHFLRALVRSVLGGVDGVSQDLEAANNLMPEVSPTEALRRYRLSVLVLDAAFDRVAESVKETLPRAAVKPKAPEVLETVDNVRALIASQEALIQAQIVPSEAKQAHARRVLARKLLIQSVTDLVAFGEGTQDAIGDARINLGDAIRQMGTARSEWSPVRNGPASGS